MRFIYLSAFLWLAGNSLYAQATVTEIDGGHERWEYVLEGSGDVLQLALPLGAGMITLIKKDLEGTKQLALSYGTTMLLTYGLKYAVKKQRPEGREQYDAFPSGHTSSAFSGASFIQRRYGWKYGWIAYLLATVVGVSRMEGPDGFHDFWDVAGGAAVGIGSTYLFTKPYSETITEISFISGNGNYLLGIQMRF